jgi:23S rRNA G2445 N2-methylase RlmL
MMEGICLSPLGKTWIIDLDGTIMKHNGYKLDGYDTLLDGAESFLRNIPREDLIVFITSRADEQRDRTEKFLAEHRIRYDHIIYNAPFGERILINDKKPSGLKTAIAVNIERDQFCKINFIIDEKL